MIQIRVPIWGGNPRKRCIGVAEYRMQYPYFELEIIYKDRNGNRIYPGVYRMDNEKAFTYPVQTIKGVRLRIIPIEDLTLIT